MLDKRQVKIDNAETGSISGYLVTWGDKNTVDLQGEYFTPATDFGLRHFDACPLLYYMPGDDEPVVNYGIANVIVRLGTLNNVSVDDYGLFVRATLDLRVSRIKEILFAIDRGVFYWLISSVYNSVNIEENGEIAQWIIVDGFLTTSSV